MTNGHRIMTSPFDDAQIAIRNFLGHFSRHSNGKASIEIAVPHANRHSQFVEGKSPRLCKQLRIRQYAFGRRFPSAALTLETSFKSQFVTQRLGIAWLEKSQEPGAAAPRRPQRKKWPRQSKSEATERSWKSLVGKHQPSIEREQSTVIAQSGNVGCATHDRNDTDTLRHCPGQGISVGRAA